MSTSPEADHQLVEIDSPAWCWSRLRSAREGILMFSASGRRATLAVPFAVDGDQIVIGLASINTAGWRAAGGRTMLEIYGTGADGCRWLVQVAGRAYRTQATEQAAALLASPLERPRLESDAPSRQLTMPSVRVRGFAEPSSRCRPATPGRLGLLTSAAQDRR